jgi:peptide deformylase
MILPIIGYGDPVLRKVAENLLSSLTWKKRLHYVMKPCITPMVGWFSARRGKAIRIFVSYRHYTFSDDEDLDSAEQKN